MGAELGLNTHFGVAAARQMLADLLDRVLSGNIAVIERRGEKGVALVDAREHDRLLARAFPFSPQVYFEEAGTSIWLPELAVFGQGSDLDEAMDDLVLAVIDYVEAWQEEELNRAPNHEARSGWVHRIQLADRPEAIRQLLIDQDEASDLQAAPPVLRGGQLARSGR
ncbi:MAG: hypothetical protein ACRDIX_00925 [Actinomycetota bacterium]